MRAVRCLVVTLIGLLGVAGLPAARAANPLPHMQLDPAATTVSGLSSGAYMAVQVHVPAPAALSAPA